MSELQRLLVDTTGPTWSATWSSFLFNVEAVKSLGTPNDAQAIITSGEAWRGDGWSTSRASKILYQVTSVPLVSATIEEYKAAFLYSLALHWGLDVPTYELSERASDAAFALEAAYSWDADGGAEHDDADMQQEDDEDAPELVFPWEERLTPLPQALAVLWKRYGQVNTVRFDTKQLLDKVEKFQGLPAKAAPNNLLEPYEEKGQLGRFDRLARSQQQHLLHSLRVQSKVLLLLGLSGAPANTSANPPAEPQDAAQLLLEHWAFTAAQVSKLDAERKDSVVPGSSAQDQECLFGGDEVREAQQRKKLQELRRGTVGAFGTATGPRCSFRGSVCVSSGKGYKGKGHGGPGGRFNPGHGGRFFQGHGGKGKGKGAKGKGKGTAGTSAPEQASTSLSQGKDGSLEAGRCKLLGDGNHPARCAVNVALPNSALGANSQKFFRSGKGAAHSAGLPPSGSFTGDTPHSRNEVSYPMVCAHQNRGIRGDQKPFDKRLSLTQCSSRTSQISAGKHPTSVPNAPERNACHKS